MLTLANGSEIKVEPDSARGGLTLSFDLADDTRLQVSPVWQTAGWQCQFLHLAPHQALALSDDRYLLKVITGTEISSARSCFAADREVRTTRLVRAGQDETASGEHQRVIVAGDSGLLAALFLETDLVRSNIHDMSSVEFSGPQSDYLQWRSFKERFGAVTPYFDKLDNHMADGFHLRTTSGEQICYVNFWTCGQGGDVSTHNHAQTPTPEYPAFAEVHLVLNNAGGESGMYLASAADDPERQMFPMQRGEEHGPFFHHSGKGPDRLENGAISYPWHGWQNPVTQTNENAYDYVAAFEIYPAFVAL